MDDTLLSVAAWRPAEQWQADDESVELCMKVYMTRGRYVLLTAGVLVAWAAVLIALGASTALAVAFLIIAVAMVGLTGWRWFVVGRWLPAAKALLSGSPSHRLPAVVVAHKDTGTVVAVGDRYLRVRLLSWGMRQVIARTGEITLVGPDVKGNAVVFVDGQPAPLPARVVAKPAQTTVEPVVPVSRNGAQDAVPMSHARQRARALLIPFAAPLLVIVALVYDATQPIPLLTDVRIEALAIYSWPIAAFGALAMLAGLITVSPQLRLPKLLAAGQWQEYQAVALSWRGESRRPVADLTVQLTRTNGELRRMVVKAAPVELVAHVHATGTLWIIDAGTAAGVPGYPIAAPARFV
ncbi:hypothetical protein [Kutzneria buriramensis]|uniref:Uncharacterized protein n=1 Tax=Kutzneria buriramensis TaxID=1045776 RepID=A0A3E0HU63_9PSEU|nr:hypothetical protein [Kutzneria buriramensis]REH49997.1 hypothetical protein BCF44_104264 [Kutzneria buriramensis]